MKEMLSARTLAGLDARIAVLQVGRCLIPSRVRVRGTIVECLVPTWAGLGDMLERPREARLAVVVEAGPALSWVFIRGNASLVMNPDLEGLTLPGVGRANRTDLYESVRVEPVRIEIVDERRGWGYRETVDL